MLDDQAAIQKIIDYIKQNWNLDEKYLFTVEKIETSINSDSTCHIFQVNFNIILYFKYNTVFSV